MLQTKGYAAQSATSPIAPFGFERRDVADNDILIDIKFCGICHSDIHQARDGWGGSVFPMVPGHEIVGIVSKVGSKVKNFKAGDRAGVGCMVDSCRTCEQCKRGLEQYCDFGAIWTYNAKDKKGNVTYGGYSDKIVVDESFALRMPANLDMAGSAPLLCAGITTYSPLKHWKAGPGVKVAIVGLGGLGHMGVKLAHALGADVTVLSQSMKKAADAKRLGADHYYATGEEGTFKKLNRAFDLIINTVAAPMNLNDYLGTLKVDGTMVNVGVPEEEDKVAAFSLIMGRRSLAGSGIGGIAETQEMLDFCGKHNIVSDIELTPIQKVNEAYERVLKSDVRYRFVIDMGTL